ncbi:hypothetical protein [Rubricoccus marinus]|uniref:Uncharacterized protein n=1 Tax=Rubricoccus marinus TaxID=716817 RepID=A0A259U2D3_9BACT|nr:hypothetical protein [Rubricoccus marinus]OZC04142.1 hypothetical protein BSZ36_14815 [Rubricoccus marinus]
MSSPRFSRRLLQQQARRARRKALESRASDEAVVRSGAGGGLAWRLVPLRGRFLAPFTKLILAALPDHPASFSAVDVAVACQEAEAAVGGDPPCNPAEIMDLLVSRGLVEWSADGFRKRQRRMRPRA